MTALANVIRSKANIQTALSISGMIEAINNLTGEGAQITLGEIDQNGNFQPISFDETTASASGQSISISSYYTWNNSFSNSTNLQPADEYLTQDYTGNINVEIAWPNGTVNNVQLPYINPGKWGKTDPGTPCLCREDEHCGELYVSLQNGGQIRCGDSTGNSISFNNLASQIPLNINLVTCQQSIHSWRFIGPSSVIITKVN